MEMSVIAWNVPNIITLAFMIAFVWLIVAGGRKVLTSRKAASAA